MQAKKCGSKWILRIDKGEEVVATLRDFCDSRGVRLASVSGIGAADTVVIGYFETAAKKYHTLERTGDHEITNLSGTVSTMGGQVYLHLHITLSDPNGQAFGGHLSSALVSGTCEIVLDPIEGEVDRELSQEVGLNLLKL
ncbi:MAG: PPC domain-containing DNA-binding protein [bacterium]